MALLLAGAAGALVLRSPAGGAGIRVRCLKTEVSGLPHRAAPHAGPEASSAQVTIRVNQVGYGTGCVKQALVMSRSPLDAAGFTVRTTRGGVSFSGRLGAAGRPWSSTWRYVYPADFSALHITGTYVLAAAGALSPTFRVNDARGLYAPLAANAVRFFQAQRDGPRQLPGPMGRQPSHLLDARAAIYEQPAYRDRQLLSALRPTGTRIDAAGGWFDAGDYLKFVETASFDDVLMLISLRDYPQGVGDRAALTREARFGIDWLLKMWDAKRRVLYYQVGIGDGNGAGVLGDHDLWRLPQADDTRAGSSNPRSRAFFVANRPVFAANAPGGPISPNLAGRVAAALALCAQVFAAQDRPYAERCAREGRAVYAQADTHPSGDLLTTSPHVYYGEQEYRDDLALGAVELYLSTRSLHATGRDYADLTRAGRWLNAYISASTNGRDSLNLYDVSSLAGFDLARAFRKIGYPVNGRLAGLDVPTDPNSIISDQHDQLAQAARLSAATSFGLANPATNQDTVPHALGYAVQARLYGRLTGSTAFEQLAATQLDWALGQNPWGSSFVVGAGATFPHCLAHQVANLSGALTGSGRILAGAVVDGPNDPAALRGLGAPDGFRACSAGNFAGFNAPAFGYVDDVRSSSSSEPSDDYVALSLLAFAQEAQTG
ncbi:MAG: glycoside hydrolase family 9 protein [Solirubrobacteraceae bacterium]